MTFDDFKSIEDAECTCLNQESTWDHEMECELWDCEAFSNGLAWWDNTEGHLVLLGPEELNDMSVDLEDPDVQRLITLHEAAQDVLPESERVMYSLDDLTPLSVLAAVDPQIRKVVEERIDSWVDSHTTNPKNFSYRGVTWVWDPDEKTWFAKKLGCYCGNLVMDPDIKACKDCQVIRTSPHSSYWRQSLIRGNEVTCRCGYSPMWQCVSCGIRRTREFHPWSATIKDGGKKVNQNRKLPGMEGGAVSYAEYGYGAEYGYVKDRHYGTVVEMPDGVKFWASSQHKRSEGDPLPDFGFYLDKAWTPQCLAIYCPWTDYGLPELAFSRVVEGIKAIHAMAKNGQIVEIGCIGGHGRTGTVLACLAVLSGVEGTKAAAWVRNTYCQHAIESVKQEWFIEWFDCTLRGVEPPEMPKPPPVVNGMKPIHKAVNEGRYVKLYIDSTKTMYCGACLTDCNDEQQKAGVATQCFWCKGLFTDKDEDLEAKAADKPHIKPSSKSEKKKGGKQGPKVSELPFRLRVQASGDELLAGLKVWAEDRLWPKDKVKVTWVDGFHCSHCKDAVSWRWPTEKFESGWVHRTKPALLLADCESEREYAQCWWNIAKQVRDANQRHGVKMQVPTKKEEVK